MNHPKISIIVPVYNTEKYIERCIKSIISQSFTDFEIICVDDASSDSSYKILQEIAAKDTRIKLWRNSQNEGAGYTKNVALHKAVGEYLCFVDSDDWLVENALKTLYENAKKYNVDDVFYLSYNMNEGDTEFLKAMNPFPCFEDLHVYNGIDFLDSMLENKCLTIGAVHHFCKKNLVLKHTAFSEKIINDDMMFTCKLLSNLQSVLFFKQEFYVYFHRKSGSISNIKKDISFYKECILNGLALYKAMVKSAAMSKLAEKILIYSIALADNISLKFSETDRLSCKSFLDKAFDLDNKNEIIAKADNYGIYVNLRKESLNKFHSKNLYIYGTGLYACDIYRLLCANDIDVKAFIVSNKTSESVFGKTVYSIADFIVPENSILIIGTSEKFYTEILANAKIKQFSEVILSKDL